MSNRLLIWLSYRELALCRVLGLDCVRPLQRIIDLTWGPDAHA